jgi:15-cis-phytoene synthase
MSPGTSQASYPLTVLYTQAAEAARAGARTFFFATKFFPPDLARSAHAVYWYCEYTRTLVREAESAAQGHANLDRWASMVTAGLRGHLARHPVLDVFLDTAARCGIPAEQPLELIEGYRMDLTHMDLTHAGQTHSRYDSFSQLAGHCRRTGGMVSLMMAQVVGYRDPAPDYMVDLGVAVDLTTNLRDLGEHLSRGYISIPLEEMRAFDYSEADLEARVRNTAFENLMRYQAARIHDYYQKAEPGLALLDSRGRFAVRVAFDLYRQTLRRIEASGFDVFRKRAAVPAMSRYWITARSMAGPITRRLWKGRSA